MKKLIAALMFAMLTFGLLPAHADNGADPGQIFFAANSYYQKQDYAKALDEYKKILDLGFESGRLYYNIGNCYFKLGKTGYAILYYEKALRLMPQDGDLRSNLVYARSVAGISQDASGQSNSLVSTLIAPFREFSLRTTAVLSLIIYIFMIAIAIASMLNPVFFKKLPMALPVAVVLALAGLAALGIRYYYEEVRKNGIAVKDGVECKYEPIDKSTTYYKLQEGDKVLIMNTGSGWRHIRRPDGKIAWVDAAAVEEI